MVTGSLPLRGTEEEGDSTMPDIIAPPSATLPTMVGKPVAGEATLVIDDLIGQVVASHEIRRPIGAGGMGTVYECWHTVMDKRRAMKVLNRKMAARAEIVARFIQEAI